MPTTPILGITQVSTSQNGKETTINDAILALENATNSKLVVSMAAGNVTLTAAEATRNFIFEATSASAARELRFPDAVNGNPYNRVIVVRNESGHGLTVRFTSAGLTTVIIPNGESRLISADAATGMDVAAEPPSVISFLSLTDSPNTFASQAGRFLAVNTAENALEFVTGAQFPALAGNANRFLMVNGAANGVVWATPNFPDTFLELLDTPASYVGQANKIVRVNSAGTALEFADPDDVEVVTYASAQRWRLFLLEPGIWPENDPELDPDDPEFITPTDQVGFGEIEFLDQDGNDLTATGTATASNSLSGFEPSRAFNNNTNPGDGWLTEEGFVGEVWIEYDFGAPVEPRRVRLSAINEFPQYGPMRFLIQYWDGITWVTAGDRPAALWALEPVQTFSINGIPLEILPEAPINGSLYGRYNGSWLKINAEVATVTTTSYNLDGSEVFQYRRFTNTATKTYNIRTEATHPVPVDGEWFIHNAVGAALNIVPASGVTVNAPAGGSLIVPARGTVRIKRVGLNTYDVFGNTVSTEAAGEIPPLIGNANRVLSVLPDASGMAWINPPVTYTDEQARDAIGAALRAGTNVSINVNDAADTITISASSIGLNEEEVRDTIAAALRNGTNISIVHNDAADTITISTTALDAEGVRDTIGAALVAGSNVTINVNDAANTITIAAATDQEVVRDTIGAALVAGSNVLIDVNDDANTITISSVGGGGGGGLDAEDVRDVIGAALVAGANITITVDDPGNTITIASSGVDAEAVRDTIGAALVAGAGISINVNDAADTITIANTVDAEVIRDTIGAALVAGTNVTINVDDPGNTITISATGAGTDPEIVRDTIGTALVAGANVTITVNDLADTITIAAAGTDAEVVRDTIGAALVAGANVTINVNDAANTITISAAGTDGEVVRDTIGAALVAGTGISIVVNDAADTITINATGGGGSGDSGVGPGSGSGNGLKVISETIVGPGGLPEIVVAIPPGYSDLKIVGTGRTTANVVDTSLRLNFNGDLGNNYGVDRTNWLGRVRGNTENALDVAALSGALAATNASGGFEVTVQSYEGNLHKTVSFEGVWTADGSPSLYGGGGMWRNTAPIQTLRLAPATGSFAEGTEIRVYGVKQSAFGDGASPAVLGVPNSFSTTTTTPSVNLYIGKWLVATEDMILKSVAFQTTMATPGARFRPFLYEVDATGTIGGLIASGNEVEGAVAGYNEARLSDDIPITKGTTVLLGISVTGVPIAGFRDGSGINCFAANGGSNIPANPGPTMSYFSGLNGYAIWGIGEVNGNASAPEIVRLFSWDGASQPPFSISDPIPLQGVDALQIIYSDVTMASAGWRTAAFSFDGGLTWETGSAPNNYENSAPSNGNIGAAGSGDDAIWFLHSTSSTAARSCQGMMWGVSAPTVKHYRSNRDTNAVHLNRAVPTHVRLVGWLSTTTQANFTGGRIEVIGYKAGTQSGLGSGLNPEEVRDVIGAALVAGAGIVVNVNDAADTITISNTVDAEVIRDTIGAALVAGSNITIDVNDIADTITIAASVVSALSGLSDVDTTTTPPVSGQALVFNAITGKWEPGTVSGGGGGGSSFLVVTTITATSHDLSSANAGQYLRFTATSPKTLNIRTQADHPLGIDSEFTLRNSDSENLTIAPAVGVTVNAPPGGSLVIPPNGVATLKRISADNFDLFGSTINGISPFVYSIPFGFAAKPLGSETMLLHVFAEEVTFQGDFETSRGVVGTNPTGSYTFFVRKNGTPVGSILISTSGVVSFATVDGNSVTFAPGDVLSIVAQDVPDATFNNSAFTLRGERT